ncbi:MAG: carboxylesterase family protein [Desulfobacteraceae bacterium]|nr:carboxylesterase family protein [Desulfobacteraceae bacterium]
MKILRGRSSKLVLILLVTAFVLTGCKVDSNPVVMTTLGKVKGEKTETAIVYRGLPFAQPPVGDLRWKAPMDPMPWDGIRDATQDQNVCVQSEVKTTWQPTGAVVGSEDCLYLDVYRPKNHDQDLPVYVFFHGGANRFGGAPNYDPSNLAKDQNLVVVIAQYRLGPLGWLRHPSLRKGDPEDDSGNFGTLDNIQALAWIQDNITAFGGDPTNVTVGGQSAGASNVAKLIISPLAAGLFQKAVMQSVGGDIITPAAGDVLAQAMLANLPGYDQIDPNNSAAVEAFLRSKTAQELVLAHGTTFSGFSDGAVLPGRYVDTIFGGKYNHVPVLLGSTEYEFKDLLPLYATNVGHPNWGYVYDLFDPNFDPAKEWTFAEIFPTQAELDLYEAMGKYQSMGWKYKAVDELATLLQNRQDGVYAFEFKWGGTSSASEEFAHVFGPAHAMDIPFFLGEEKDLFGYALTKKNQSGFRSLQQVMMGYLGNFVRNGQPGIVDGVEWKEWSNDTATDAPTYMRLDADMKKALIGMDTQKLSTEGIKAAALAEVAGWPAADAGLVLAMLNTFPAAPAEYYLNGEGYELLSSKLKFNPLPGAQAQYGVVKGAGFQAEIPSGWTPGTSDLVMYAHGYRGEITELTVTQPGRLRNYLISKGFAWAASSYTANGYNIVSGVQSTDELLKYFQTRFGTPRRVYLIGHSMGGHVTARTITDPNYAGEYTAAMPMCGVVGGGVDLFSYFLDWGLLANYYTGLNDPVPFSDEQLAEFQATVFGPANDGNGALGYIPPLGYFAAAGTMADLNAVGEEFKTATMYRSGGKRPMYDTAFARWATFAISGQSLQWLKDPTAGLGTNLVGNSSYAYQLDDDYATVSEEEAALNAGIFRVSDPVYNFEDSMYPVTGNIHIPVLTLHTIGDLFVPFSMEQLWARRIADAGHADLFRARAIRSGNHCAFTVGEEVQAFAELVAWVENGITPQGDDILNPAAVAADDFGCRFTKVANPAYGDDPTRYLDDPNFSAVCQ